MANAEYPHETSMRARIRELRPSFGRSAGLGVGPEVTAPLAHNVAESPRTRSVPEDGRNPYLTSTGKRFVDVACAIALLAFLGPICLAGGLLAWIEGLPSPFFVQVRMGKHGRPFRMFKLRTMHGDAEARGPQWAALTDARVTKIGGLLRQFRIDEVPQLVNVLRGEMSLIGPRPERPEFLRGLEQRFPKYMQRHLIPPGVTGWAQVNVGYTSSVEETADKLRHDLEYLEQASLAFDLRILAMTVMTVISRRGAR